VEGTEVTKRFSASIPPLSKANVAAT